MQLKRENPAKITAMGRFGKGAPMVGAPLLMMEKAARGPGRISGLKSRSRATDKSMMVTLSAAV